MTSQGPERKLSFDPKVFFDTENAGRTIIKYRKGQKIFAQGASSAAVSYIQKGTVQITVLSRQGEEAIIAVLGPDTVSERDAPRDRSIGWRPPYP